MVQKPRCGLTQCLQWPSPYMRPSPDHSTLGGRKEAMSLSKESMGKKPSILLDPDTWIREARQDREGGRVGPVGSAGAMSGACLSGGSQQLLSCSL